MSIGKIKVAAAISYVSIFFNIIAGLIYTPWMVRQIGASDYGLFVLSSSFLAYFLIDFGLGNAVARFLSKYRAENNHEGINNFLGQTARLYLIISMFMLIALIVIYFYIQDIFGHLSAQEIEKLRVVYFIVGLFSFLSFPFLSLNGIFTAYEKFLPLKLIDLLTKVITISLMVIALNMGYRLYALVCVNAIVGLIIILLKIGYLMKYTSIRPNLRYFDLSLVKEIFSYSVWVTLIGISQHLLINVAPIVLGAKSNTTQISIFSVGMTIEGYTWTFASAINGLFMTRVAKLALDSNNKEQILSLMIKVGRIQFLIIGFIVSGFGVFGREFIYLWMGTAFADSFYVAFILIIPCLLTLTMEIANTLMYVINYLKYSAIIYITGSFVSVLISYYIIPYYGAIGASLSIFSSIILFHVIAINIVQYKKMKINLFKFYYNTHGKMFVAFSLSIVVGMGIIQILPNISISLFVAKMILFSIAYIGLMWIFALNKDEKQRFNVKRWITIIR